MADFVNTTTLELRPSQNASPGAGWQAITRTACDAAALILPYYRKWVVDHVEEMTAGEKTTVDATRAAVAADSKELGFTLQFPSLAKGDMAVYDGSRVKRLAASTQTDGETLIVASADALGIKYARRMIPVLKLADTTRTATTTFTDDPVLTFPVLASQDYIFRGEFFFDTSAAGDFKWQLTGPGSPTGVRIKRCGILPGATSLSSIGVDTAFSVAVAMAGTGTNGGWVSFTGLLRNGVNAGNVTLQWAQNTSDAGNTVVRAGSYIEYVRIG